MILCLKFYLEQACSFDIKKYCSNLLASEILKMSSPKFSLGAYKCVRYFRMRIAVCHFDNKESIFRMA